MKKLLLIGLALTLAGCSLTKMDNTPTKKVEAFLNNYQTLDKDVLSSLDTIVENETLYTLEQKHTYREILKKHYQDLTYKIKEETINGDRATVEVEIEVTDYTKSLREAELYKINNQSDVFNESQYIDYKLDLLKSTKDKVKYTLYFSLTKIGKDWTIDNLNSIEQEKILGIYQY